MSTIELGSLIRLKRIEKGMKQKELAAALHVSATAVSKWEKGKNYPDLQNIKEISQLLEIPITELLGSCPTASMETSDTEHTASEPASQPSLPDEVSSGAEPSRPEAPVVQTEDPSEPSDTAVLDIEDADFVEIADSSVPQPERDSNCLPPKESKGRRVGLKTAIPLLAFLLVAIITVCWVAIGMKHEPPSFTVCDSYYGEYEGEYVYYVVSEYKSEPTVDDFTANNEIMRKNYEHHFSDVNEIVIIHVQNYTDYIENGFNENTDYMSILFPLY